MTTTNTEAGRTTETRGGLEPMLVREDLAVITNRSLRTIDRDISAGKIPPPDAWFGRFPRWKTSTITKYLAAHATKADA
jgi:hypothetical protein